MTAEISIKAMSELNDPEDYEERLQRIENLRQVFLKENKAYALYRTDDAVSACKKISSICSLTNVD